MSETSCIFCKIISEEIPSPRVAESSNLIVIKDINPKASTHLLIIPKTHIPTMIDISQDEKGIAWELFEMTKQLCEQLPQPASFNLISNNGVGAGQSVPHLHWHFLSGKNIYSDKFQL